MGEARGVVSKEELKAYGGANIMLLDGDNEETSSQTGGSASGSVTGNWAISWNNTTGFTGNGWDFQNQSEQWSTMAQNGTLESWLTGHSLDAYLLAMAIGTQFGSGCVSLS